MRTKELKSEERKFVPHEDLVMQVITRQAGTLSKAILEGVMNAVDAKATFVNIRLDNNQLQIVDDGRGFGSKEELIRVFEVFGQPHTAEEEKVYGTFRIGRGQLFSFGRNEWTSGKYRMLVDIKTQKLNYKLTERHTALSGCKITIELYEKLTTVNLIDVERSIEMWCKYAPIKVYFNDRLISKKLETIQWTMETDEAYILLKDTSQLVVYNLGIHVCEINSHILGTGGLVVSKQQLKVNFARNDIQSDCPVWRKIRPLVDKMAAERQKNKKTLSDSDRQKLADRFLSGDLDYQEVRTLRIFTACTGRHFAFKALNTPQIVTNAPLGNRLGDRIVRSGRAFVLADETLERFHVDDVPALFKLLQKTLVKHYNYHEDFELYCTYTDFDTLTAGENSEYTLLNADELTPSEHRWLTFISTFDNIIRIHAEDGTITPYGWGSESRKILIGESNVANGWTDATSYVAINRDWLKKRDMTPQGISDVIWLLMHEACHHTPTNQQHDHDQEFYETFHDCVRDCFGDTLSKAVAELPKALKSADRRLSKKNAEVLSRLEKVADLKVKD